MGLKKIARDQPVELHVWRFASKKVAAPHQMHALPLERIDPLIRVAHRRGGPHLNIPERVIVDHEILLILSGKGDLRFRDQSIPLGRMTCSFCSRSFRTRWSARETSITSRCTSTSRRAAGSETDLDRRKPYTVELAGAVAAPTRQQRGAHGAVERSLSLVVEHFDAGTPEGETARTRRASVRACRPARRRTPGRVESSGRRRAQLERAVGSDADAARRTT